jgi:ribokinase
MTADAGAARPPSITIVGSANLDVVAPVTRLPRPGETVIGGDHYRATGGKGANQAVACARLGARTRFVGCVGDDDAGRTLARALRDDRVDVEHLRVLPGTPSGLALIVVDEVGENTIVVSPGANARLGPEHVAAAGLGTAEAVLLQLEVPIGAVVAAAEAARGLVVLNPAPATRLPAGLLHRTDVLVPNRGELALLAGADTEPEGIDEVVDLARTLEGPGRIVVTLGSAGAVTIEADHVRQVEARAVDAVDATAAGDSFCGALTVAMTEGADLEAATRWASLAASITVGRRGAQPSLPTRAELDGVGGSDAAWSRKDEA